MESFLIDIPMPSMGATVNELTVISIRIQAGDRVAKGQKIAELESDKSIFEFESPCDGRVHSILATEGDSIASGTAFLQIETSDDSLRHLEHKGNGGPKAQPPPDAAAVTSAPVLIWTPRAAKLAMEAGLDPVRVKDIEATGPGGRVSGDDVTRYLGTRKS